MTVAVAVLARAPALGRVKTRLAADVGDVPALAIYQTLLTLALDAAAASRLPATLFLDGEADTDLHEMCRSRAIEVRPQCKGSLARRMEHALRTLQREHAAVLLTGSDCPVLDGARLGVAARALDTAQVTIHPAEDGGFVLYGERADAEVDTPFASARLGSPHALADTLEHLHRQRAVVTMLDVLWDVDTLSDARRAARLGLLGRCPADQDLTE